MTTLKLVLRYRKCLLWTLLGVVLASALWMLKVEVTYQRNVTGAYAVLVADAPATLQLESIEMNYTRSRTTAMPWPTPMHMVHRA